MDDKETREISKRGTDASGAVSTSRGVVLFVESGRSEDVGRSLKLVSGKVRIGRGEACDLPLHDDNVSREHVELEVGSKSTVVRDLGSRNGTLYLGARLQQAEVQIGSRLILGETTIVVLPISDPQAIAPDASNHYGDLLAVSISMRRLFSLLRRLENSEAPVLIEGETGTGKEVIARTIHQHSPRSKGPFNILDCGALSRELAESEIFGHSKGAFTGAVSDRPGIFESANGGTVFLDEVGELEVDLQTRLLRVLESRQVRRVGETKYRDVDFRVIAATNRPLKEDVQNKKFREDLYFRLAVVNVAVPPLRERPEDIAVLAKSLATKLRPEAPALPDSVLHGMLNYRWPGNVRELRNTVHRLVTLGADFGGEELKAQKGGASVDTSVPYKEARERVVSQFEASYLKSLMEQSSGNLSAAARTAGVERHYLRELLKKHGLYGAQE
jgi:DNA-binding NtrC family response regulator